MMHSLAGFEYAFEPPLLFSLLPTMSSIGDDAFRILFETYLFEDFYMEALAGRRLNLNEHEDSSALRAKGAEQAQKIRAGANRDKVVIIAEGRIVAEEDLATLGGTEELEAFFLKVTAHDAALSEEASEGEAAVAAAAPDGEEPAAEDAVEEPPNGGDSTGDTEEETAP
ncbi:MAG: hypothetical protein IH849_14390 [Acidobacteria bacterium]|nr:hypothetical protein [Acidobacteriota bacterium]